MRTKRLRENVEKYLAEVGKASTHQILDHCNNTTAHGTTSSQIGNILAKDERFVKCGVEKISEPPHRNYTIVVWTLRRR
jgi:hypothetical protein